MVKVVWGITSRKEAPNLEVARDSKRADMNFVFVICRYPHSLARVQFKQFISVCNLRHCIMMIFVVRVRSGVFLRWYSHIYQALVELAGLSPFVWW